LVHVLGRKANGAKLPSGGLGLNASKSESRLDNATITKLPLIGRLNYVKPLGGFTEKAPCVAFSSFERAALLIQELTMCNVGAQNHLQTT
jgi:hypothetical protein